MESETDALVDALTLRDVEVDKLADSLGVIEAEISAVSATDSLAEIESLVDVESLVAVESLVVVVESLVVVESPVVVESLVDSRAADSLVLCDVDSLDDSVAESLDAAVLPGVRTVLPSVARVFRFVVVTSYETGATWDMLYGPSSPPTVTDRIGEVTVDSWLLGSARQRSRATLSVPGSQ